MQTRQTGHKLLPLRNRDGLEAEEKESSKIQSQHFFPLSTTKKTYGSDTEDSHYKILTEELTKIRECVDLNNITNQIIIFSQILTLSNYARENPHQLPPEECLNGVHAEFQKLGIVTLNVDGLIQEIFHYARFMSFFGHPTPHKSLEITSSLKKIIAKIGFYYQGWCAEGRFSRGLAFAKSQDCYKHNFFLFLPTLQGKYWGAAVTNGYSREPYPEGYGVMLYTSGNKYEGNWKEGAYNGAGVMNYANGDQYDGNWITNMQDGLGIMNYADGEKYNGSWLKGKKHGQATLSFPDGGVCQVRYELGVLISIERIATPSEAVYLLKPYKV